MAGHSRLNKLISRNIAKYIRTNVKCVYRCRSFNSLCVLWISGFISPIFIDTGISRSRRLNSEVYFAKSERINGRIIVINVEKV